MIFRRGMKNTLYFRLIVKYGQSKKHQRRERTFPMRKFIRRILLLSCCAALMLGLTACGGSFGPASQLDAPKKGETIAVMHTTMGDIKIRLFPDQAPKAVENFTTHAKDGYYNGLKFHRVIEDFMIQGGDPQGTGAGGESIWAPPLKMNSMRTFIITGALCPWQTQVQYQRQPILHRPGRPCGRFPLLGLQPVRL